MSRREIFAAFVYSKIVDIPERGFALDKLTWLRQHAERIGLTLDIRPRTGVPADWMPDAVTEFAGLPARVVTVDDPDEYRSLVLVFGRSDFLRAHVRDEYLFEAEFATRFRDACDALDPDYAFFHPVPVESIREFLGDVDMELYGLDVRRLDSFGFPLWYSAKTMAKDLYESEAVRPSPELPSEKGVVLLAGGAPTGWFISRSRSEELRDTRRTVSDQQLRDLAGALAKVRPSWTASDAPRVAAELGWSVESGPDAGGMVLQSGLAPFGGLADIRFSGDEVTQLVVRLGDGEKERTPEFDDYRATVFARAARTLTEVLGAPSERRPGSSPQVRWALPGGQLRLSDGGVFVELSLMPERFAAVLDAEAAGDGADEYDDAGGDT
ncbi:MAG: DUF6301 family protein [Actinocatenispora sp.]